MGKGQPEAIKREFYRLGIVTEKVCRGVRGAIDCSISIIGLVGWSVD